MGSMTFRLNAVRLKDISSQDNSLKRISSKRHNTTFRLQLSKFRLKFPLKLKRKESDGTLFVRHVFQQNRLQTVASSRDSARGAITVPVQFHEALKLKEIHGAIDKSSVCMPNRTLTQRTTPVSPTPISPIPVSPMICPVSHTPISPTPVSPTLKRLTFPVSPTHHHF